VVRVAYFVWIIHVFDFVVGVIFIVNVSVAGCFYGAKERER